MSSPLQVTRIGHACQLIEIGGTRVLTDPWFTQTATYYHGEPVASTVEALGRIDAVVVSHEHYDHCDLDALAAGGFDLAVPLIGPGTVAAIARDKGFRDVRAIEAWQATTVADVTVHLQGPAGTRQVAVSGFYRMPGDTPRLENELQPDEVIVEISGAGVPGPQRSRDLAVGASRSCCGAPVIFADKAGSTWFCHCPEWSSWRRWLPRWAALGKRASHTKTFSPVRTGSAGKVFSAYSVCRDATGVTPVAISAGRAWWSKKSAKAWSNGWSR